MTDDEIVKAAVTLIGLEDAEAKAKTDLAALVAAQAGVDEFRAQDAIDKIRAGGSDLVKKATGEVPLTDPAAEISPAVEVKP